MPDYEGYGAGHNQIIVDSTDYDEFPDLNHISSEGNQQASDGYCETRDALIAFPKLSQASKHHLDTQISLMGLELEYEELR